MTTTSTVEIIVGRVSTRDDAREHLNIHGLAHCGAGTGRILTRTAWRADATLPPADVCRRCLPALRRRLAEAAATGDIYARDAATVLEPDDPRRDDALIADIRAHLRAVNTPAPTPAEQAGGLLNHEYAARLLAELRA